MAEVPSLISLGLVAIKRQLLRGDEVLPDIFELPSHLFVLLVTRLSPLALHKLQVEMPHGKCNDYEFVDGSPKHGRKRGRDGNSIQHGRCGLSCGGLCLLTEMNHLTGSRCVGKHICKKTCELNVPKMDKGLREETRDIGKEPEVMGLAKEESELADRGGNEALENDAIQAQLGKVQREASASSMEGNLEAGVTLQWT